MGLIPITFFDCVVALCYENEKREVKGLASGFLYAFHTPTEKNPNNYRPFLVTNRHVFEGLETVLVRFNPKKIDAPAKIYSLPLLNEKKEPIWVAHPDKEIDVAVVPANCEQLDEAAIQYHLFRSNTCVADVKKLNELGIMEGDFAYVLGFPLGLIGENRNTVIARSGTIARIREALAKNNNEFLIDAFVFPGNSGGPVVSKPEAFAIEKTKRQMSSYLIGIVKSYIEINIQQEHPRIIVKQNSGLAAVHPVDYINETIDFALEREKESK
jgi:S1-C subfamily serine protease